MCVITGLCGVLLCGPAHGELDGTAIEIVEPDMPITPGLDYVFVFEIWRADSSDERTTTSPAP